MGSDLRVGVVGATGALGAEIIKVLDAAPWRPEGLVALASATTTTSHVEYGDERVPVDDVADEALDGLDLVILALPAEAARPIGEAAVREGVPVVDCTGAFADDADVPLVIPWVNPEVLQEVRGGVVAVPTPEVILLASVLGPLKRAGIEGRASATVLVPASRAGRQGVEELSRQVVALFNAGTPPRRVFPTGLAFDLLPAVGAVEEDGWTDRERAISERLGYLLDWPEPVDVSVVGVPVFSGLAATLQLTPTRAVPPELAQRILADGGVQVPEEAAGVRALPRPRRVEGQPFAHVGRVRLGGDDRTLHLWLGIDNLRATATVAASCAAVLTDAPSRTTG
jgi:aspartate-semialdehyde dehydrogenase